MRTRPSCVAHPEHGDFDWDGTDIANGVITRHANQRHGQLRGAVGSGHGEPTEDGRGTEWNQCEKFYFGERQMALLIRTFLAHGVKLAAEFAAPIEGCNYAPEFERARPGLSLRRQRQ